MLFKEPLFVECLEAVVALEVVKELVMLYKELLEELSHRHKHLSESDILQMHYQKS